jgi:hypothetical protein
MVGFRLQNFGGEKNGACLGNARVDAGCLFAPPPSSPPPPKKLKRKSAAKRRDCARAPDDKKVNECHSQKERRRGLDARCVRA